MAQYLPPYLLKRLFSLSSKFNERTFSFEEARNSLKEDSRIVALVLSRISRKGWIEVSSDPKNKQKSLYRIKNPGLVKEMAKNMELE